MGMIKNKMLKRIRTIFCIPLRFFWIFPIKYDRLMFQSFNGNSYSDSCKAMIDYLHANFPKRYEMYWVFTDDSELCLPNYTDLHSVKKHTMKYFYLCLTARVAVCNISQECELPLRKKQKLVNAWHGMPYKTVGLARAKDNAIPNYNVCSLFLSPCKFYTEEVLRNSFHYIGPVLESGLPRNDLLFQSDHSHLKKMIYDHYHLDGATNTVLFAPTFRGDFKEADIQLDFNGVTEALQERFGGKWVLLYRVHPMVVCKNKAVGAAINVSYYPDIMELIAVSSVLITDYSSSMWDFALTGKPVFLYAPDLKDYSTDRGFYVDMEKLPFELGHNNKELQNQIRGFKTENYQVRLKEYFKSMGNYDKGHACEILAHEIEQWCSEDIKET